MHWARAALILLCSLTVATEGRACSVMSIVSNVALVGTSDAIVRAKAVEYASPPSHMHSWTTGVPDAKVRFKVLETVRGQNLSDLTLPGYLSQTNDFNDRKPPYTFVRPGGRGGGCFANSYRQDAQFLLFLKRAKTGEWTVYWAPLAPANEQLHSENDEWLLWVREQARQAKSSSKP